MKKNTGLKSCNSISNKYKVTDELCPVQSNLLNPKIYLSFGRVSDFLVS